ncbi:thioredoxin domain-containing protein [Candidatus Microgenomates bacterium]|nr:thioredoxin domain-containing protein [Candidatus Microgenomates bacterium]
MPNDVKVFLSIIGGTLLLVFGAAFLLGRGSSNTPADNTAADANILVRADSWKVGTASAKVTVVEFSDFQCPSCKAAEPQIESLRTKYADNLMFVYRHFPLPNHEFAFGAAEAAEAAGLQGKFWEMHNKLFELSPILGKDALVQAAKDLGLDTDKFTKDLDSDPVRQKVLNDQTDGNNLKVNATPTFFVNGKQLVGVTDLETEINGQLAR